MYLNYFDLIKSRYSCRNFKDERISDEELNKILESGIIAPTAVNYQPERIYVINDDKLIDVMHNNFKNTFNAKTILVVCYDNNEAWTRKRDSKCFGEVDATIVATHMMLACEALDIGCCYVCSFDELKLREILNININHIVSCMLMIGYKNDSPKEKQRKDLKDIVIYR